MCFPSSLSWAIDLRKFCLYRILFVLSSPATISFSVELFVSQVQVFANWKKTVIHYSSHLTVLLFLILSSTCIYEQPCCFHSGFHCRTLELVSSRRISSLATLNWWTCKSGHKDPSLISIWLSWSDSQPVPYDLSPFSSCVIRVKSWDHKHCWTCSSRQPTFPTCPPFFSLPRIPVYRACVIISHGALLFEFISTPHHTKTLLRSGICFFIAWTFFGWQL